MAQLGAMALIAPRAVEAKTSASHPGVIVSVGVEGFEKKDVFVARPGCAAHRTVDGVVATPCGRILK